MSCDLTDLVDHITLWMPTLVSHIAVDLDELLQDGTVAPRAFRRKPGRIMIVAVDIRFVLVVRVLRTKQCRAHGACEMLYVELFVYGICIVKYRANDHTAEYALHAVM